MPVFEKGKCVYDLPKIDEIRDYCASQVDRLWEEVRRFENPQTYYVDLSTKLWKMKHDIIEEHT